VLAAVYIKGFKTFARPVRMPLEGGVTAIVGPNGSGKSNITDAVLFALGEQSPGVLRAGAMSELIFSGSETLPAAGVAEVTLVLDNASGRISLPYREVSVTRRVSRGGETEYRINGSRARLADVRAVAGEAGLGRHSILRQGAVDAIVAGGAAACRDALEEAAGLGVFRRRRLSASRRLEKADAQLEKSRQLEAELANQLRRIQSEAVAAREYRKLEARYRELSLAHLYRVATRGLEGLRGSLEEARERAAEVSARAEATRAEEEALGGRLADLDGRLREAEVLLEAVEDGTEDLRAESSRAERVLFRLESGREHEPRSSVSRLEAELGRVSRALASLEEREGRLERENAAKRSESERLLAALARARDYASVAAKERSRLASRLDGIRSRLAHDPSAGLAVLSEEDLGRLANSVRGLGATAAGDGFDERLKRLRGRLAEGTARVDGKGAGIGRRRGALEAAIGRTESRVRALRRPTPGGSGTRLYEVIRARPGYEGAVEAALGEYGAGVLAANLEEGMRLLSGTERVAVRLDAQGVATNGDPPGKPLLDCVEVLDPSYAEAVRRLLDGTFVVERPGERPHVNGYVAVTRDGFRLTRTSVSLRRGGGGFAREARLASAVERLDALKNGPGEALYDLGEGLSAALRDLDRLTETVQALPALAHRTGRAAALLSRRAERRLAAAQGTRGERLRRDREGEALTRERAECEAALAAAEVSAARAEERLAAAAAEADDARAVAAETGRRLARVRASISEGRGRRARISRELDRAREAPEHATGRLTAFSGRAVAASTALADALRTRRRALRAARTASAEAHRHASEQRNDLAHRAAELAGELARLCGETERLAAELARAESEAAGAVEEIGAEWGATLEVARREAERHPGDAEVQRSSLARRLKRFGDVNLLALSQEESLRERLRFVAAQRADAEAAATELNRIIHSIDAEIEARFGETFGRVRAAFGEMVPRMMQGASGVLDLSEEGVEVGLRLGRRGWRPLRVLSGGERSLLALSFLFSIFLSRPEGDGGAFCVLDEAEAALDDLNLARFLAVVDSHRMGGQYLLVTHQKRTMAAADVLFGVVQDATGSTTVVSKRMQGE
jgi:chromosome segregation protein